VLYGTAYTLLGVRLAIPIGIVAGALNFVPYLGSAFALISGLLMSALGGASLGQMLGVVAVSTAIQTLEGFFITPRIVGKTVGLRDVWVLLALFVGGELFGFLGVLLALPVAAVAKIFVLRGVDRYRATTLFRGEPPLPSMRPPPRPTQDA
jgi:predicted PurR-regulated permease PerM